VALHFSFISAQKDIRYRPSVSVRHRGGAVKNGWRYSSMDRRDSHKCFPCTAAANKELNVNVAKDSKAICCPSSACDCKM